MIEIYVDSGVFAPNLQVKIQKSTFKVGKKLFFVVDFIYSHIFIDF